jgi:hypothetical protein
MVEDEVATEVLAITGTQFTVLVGRAFRLGTAHMLVPPTVVVTTAPELMVTNAGVTTRNTALPGAFRYVASLLTRSQYPNPGLSAVNVKIEVDNGSLPV